MRRQARTFLHFMLTIVLTVGVILSANVRSLTHDPVAIAAIISQHQTEIDDHGHAHDDIVGAVHADQGHAHDMADHDHNPAFLSPPHSASSFTPSRSNWTRANIIMSDRRAFDLDRPPRA